MWRSGLSIAVTVRLGWRSNIAAGSAWAPRARPGATATAAAGRRSCRTTWGRLARPLADEVGDRYGHDHLVRAGLDRRRRVLDNAREGAVIHGVGDWRDRLADGGDARDPDAGTGGEGV